MAILKMIISIALIISCSVMIYKIIAMYFSGKKYKQKKNDFNKSEYIEHDLFYIMQSIGLINEFYLRSPVTKKIDAIVDRNKLGDRFDYLCISHIRHTITMKYLDKRREALEEWTSKIK